MKQTIKFFTLLLFSTVLFSSCGGDDPADNTESSITINSNRQEAILETAEAFTFTVGNNLSENVTSSSTIYVNGTAISGSYYTPTTLGDYQVYATKGDLTSNTITVHSVTGLESLTISADNSMVAAGGTINFSLTDNMNRDLTTTSGVSYTANGSAIDSNIFSPATGGEYQIQATYQGVTSNTITVNFLENVYTKKVLIEDYTGAWCGWCPRVAYSIELVEAATDNAIPVAVHNGDTMTYEYESQLRSYFGVSSFPTAKLNRTTDWTSPENSNVSQVTNLIDNVYDIGLAISSTRTGNDLAITVSAKFETTHTENLNLILYLVEDGLYETQTNYTSFYGGTSEITNMEHNHVLRKTYTDLLGNAIPSSDTEIGDTYTSSFNVTIPTSSQATASDKLQLVAFIVNGDTKVALNAQSAYVGTTQNFD